MIIKRVFSFLFVCVFIAVLSLTSYASIFVGDNGVIYSDLPEPSPYGDSCAFAFTVDNNGITNYYLMTFQLIRWIDSTIVNDVDDLAPDGQKRSYAIYEKGNISTNITIDLSVPSITFRLYDGDTLLLISDLLDSMHLDVGFTGYLQLYNLSTNSIASYGDIKSSYQYLKTYNWKVTSWKAYGNCLVNYVNFSSDDYPQMIQMPIAWNNSFTDLDTVKMLNDVNSRLEWFKDVSGFSNTDSTLNSYLNDYDSYISLYFPAIYDLLQSQDSHSSNIDNALNGSGSSYSAFDKSTIDQYDELEKSLNSDFSGDFSSLVGSINMNDFVNSFQFWRNSFNSLIINPGNNIGYILTSFITFALLLGLVIFILGKRG